jgi:hypothetical protein
MEYRMTIKIQRCGSEMAWANCRFRGAEENKIEDGCECCASKDMYAECPYKATFKPTMIDRIWPEEKQ